MKLTPAEFKTTRESLHLTLDWLAKRWNVHRQSVQRWEGGYRAIPHYISADLESLRTQAYMIINDGIKQADTVITVPRTDQLCTDDMPAAWHRMIAQQIASTTGATITYNNQ